MDGRCLRFRPFIVRKIAKMTKVKEKQLIEEIVGAQLVAQKMKVSTAESCTGGGIAARLTSVAGSSQYVEGGIVAYAVEVKENILGVPADIIERFGVDSEETVTAMAKCVMAKMGTDCAVATTGVAGPGGGSDINPVGNIWIAAAVGNKIQTKLQTADDGRQKNIERAINNALLMLSVLLRRQ